MHKELQQSKFEDNQIKHFRTMKGDAKAKTLKQEEKLKDIIDRK